MYNDSYSASPDMRDIKKTNKGIINSKNNYNNYGYGV
jgi:hypothetical protein